jgi:hypothetical protein
MLLLCKTFALNEDDKKKRSKKMKIQKKCNMKIHSDLHQKKQVKTAIE